MSVPIPENRDTEKALQAIDDTHSLAIDQDDESIHASRRSEKDHISMSKVPSRQSQALHSKPLEALTKVLTARSNASVRDPGPPPDKGLVAWTQAFMGHFVVFNTWGIISSFGVFQTYYTTEFGFEPSAVSWIGSVQMFFHFFMGMLSGRALDAGYFHWVVFPGVLVAALGTFMTSLCSQYWQFFLAQGVLTGFGCGLQFTPATSLVATYFVKNRAFAMALVASGSATGGLVYPTIVRQLLPKLGFGWTVRVIGFIMLAVGACYCSLFRPRLPPRKSGPLVELAAFREAPYTLYCVGVFLVLWGQYFVYYYVGSFGLKIIGITYSTSVSLLMIMNGVGLVGRLIPAFLADRYFGPYNTLLPFSFIGAIILYTWAAVTDEGGLYAFAITYGVLSASFQGLFPSALSSLTYDMSKVGVRNGMGFSIAGIACLTGPPLAGALIQKEDGHYLGAQMWAGSVILVGGVVLLLGRISKTGKVLRVRA